MTKFQEKCAEALGEMGYKQKYEHVPTKFQKNDAGDIVDIKHVKTLYDILVIMYRTGAQEKVWEIQRVLQIS